MSETNIDRFRKTGLRFLLPAVLAAMVVGLLACGGGAQPAAETQSAAATGGSAPASGGGGQSAPAPAQPTAAMAQETQLETQGESFEFQLVCINRNVAGCELVNSYFIPEIAERTNGQLTFTLSSFPELGIAGPDTLRLIEDNTLEVGEVYSGYVGGDLPLLDIGNLWGLSPSEEAHLELTDAIHDDLVTVLKETTGGQPIMRQYYPNQFIFSREELETLDQFKNKNIRQHSTILGDLLAGLGAEGQFVAFADVYTALERGVLDGGVTGGEPGHSQRWYEVTDYLYGPIVGSVAVAYYTMSGDSWNRLPPDIQQITLEVGRDYEELARKTLIEEWNPFSVSANVESGMIHRPFSPEVQTKMREVALEVILPNWVQRTGGPDSAAAKLYNDKVAPIIGVAINPDGSANEITAMSEKPPVAMAQEAITLQVVCINRSLRPCELIRDFYAPKIAERTDGAVTIEISSYPELGLGGPDTIRLVNDHTLEFAEIYSGYVGGDLPVIDVGNLWGLSPSNDAHFALTDAIEEDMIRILRDATGGEPVFRNYYPNQYIFSRVPLPDLASYEGKKIRQHSTILGDLLAGVGAEGQFVAFADVYTALERGVLDGGVTGGTPGYGQRWYEVTDYLYGPIVGSIGVTYVTVNSKKWAELTPESQAILKEVGKEYEAENLRLLKEEWDPAGITLNVEEGMEYSDFPDDVKARMREAALNLIIPNWVQRAGGPDSEGVRIFNEKVGPIVNVEINPDGTASATE